jgi:ATP-GRASP peptide maturase of grasp-with-spasm system
MILILSQRLREVSTETLMEWLNFLGGKHKRVNGLNILGLDFAKDQKTLKFRDDQISLDNVNVIYFRRYISFEKLFNIKALNLDNKNNSILANHISSELKTNYDYFLSLFPKATKISSLKSEKDLNKLIILKEAEKAGFNIPDFIVTANKISLTQFINKYEKCIVKPLSECSTHLFDNSIYKMLTELITIDSLKLIPDKFFPSFFQNCIEKNYEIRVFFIDNKCYSMAIFSQKNDKTTTDFRNYDYVKPNRTVPYKLPSVETEKIIKFMNKMNFKIGSIDLIKSVDNEYIFLEVNLNGQYGMLSHACNYHLDKKIAQYLMNQ